MRKCPTSVIPSAARDLVFSATYEEEISRLHLEMTVATQSVRRKGTDRPCTELNRAARTNVAGIRVEPGIEKDCHDVKV